MKVLVSDFDGTLYRSNEELKENLKAIQKFREKGNLFLVSTGRSYFDFHKRVDEFPIFYDAVILNHGAIAMDSKNQLIHFTFLSSNDVGNLFSYLRLEESVSSFGAQIKESRIPLEKKDFSKITVYYKNPSIRDEVEQILKKEAQTYAQVYPIGDSSIEIISSKTSKSKALKKLSKKWNFVLNEVYTIGDSYSDISMVRDFHGFCMEDSVDALKPYAKKQYEKVSDLIEELLK